jgi:hypothetical protein
MLGAYVLFVFNLLAVYNCQKLYECDFEEVCKDFVLDNNWIVKDTSTHVDHTYGSLLGHYATYQMTSTSSIVRSRGSINPAANQTSCMSIWLYSALGSVTLNFEMAQGDDQQARLSAGQIGMSVDNPQWRGSTIELPYANNYVLYVDFLNVTGMLDIDDLSISLCPPSMPIMPILTLLDCDFDQLSCTDLVSLSNYAYNWSSVQAAIAADNGTSGAPMIDHSTGTAEGSSVTHSNILFVDR